MNAEQISLLRDYHTKDDGTKKPMADVLAYVFNNELAYVNTQDFIITDDSMELIHAIKANVEHPVNQAYNPFKIMTGFYGNIQYVEALYNMTNFTTAVKELFLDKGLINQTQYDMIIKWSKGIRNQRSVPKNPGPYFKDTILPISATPVEERRDDGLHHASATHMPTLLKKIDDIIIPLIESSAMSPVKKVKNHYVIKTDDVSTFGAEFKKIIEGMGEDLFIATLADAHTHALYDPKSELTVANFEKYAQKLMPTERNIEKGLVMYIEAFDTRCEYHFDIFLEVEEEEDPAIWVANTKKEIYTLIKNFNPDVGEISISGSTISATIDEEASKDDILFLIDDVSSIDGVEKITYTVDSTTLEYNVGDDPNTFIEGVISTMPNTNGQTTNGSVAAVSATGASVVYTLKVKYYNEAECPCKIGDTFYTTLAECIAAAKDGDVITLVNNIDVDNTINIDKNITLDGNGVVISSGTSMWKTFTINDNGGTATDVTFKNMTIENDYNNARCIDTRGGLENLTLDGVILKTNSAHNNQPITVGGDQQGAVLNIKLQNNTQIEAGEAGYGIIAFNKVNLDIDNSNITGFAALYMKAASNSDGSNGSVINVTNSTLIGTNKFSSTGNNDFATIAFEDDNIVVNIDSSNVNTDVTGDAIQGVIGFVESTSNNTVNFTGDCNVNGIIKNGTGTNNVINIFAGSFSNDPTDYLASGYKAELVDGKYVVSTKPAEEVAEEKIDSFLEGLDYEGVVVEADPEELNTYNITTNNGSITECGLIDEVASIEGMTSIEISDGTSVVKYNAGEDLDAFKASIDSMVPQSNTASETVLTMTVNL